VQTLTHECFQFAKSGEDRNEYPKGSIWGFSKVIDSKKRVMLKPVQSMCAVGAKLHEHTWWHMPSHNNMQTTSGGVVMIIHEESHVVRMFTDVMWYRVRYGRTPIIQMSWLCVMERSCGFHNVAHSSKELGLTVWMPN
jgi:hypothetical protein